MFSDTFESKKAFFEAELVKRGFVESVSYAGIFFLTIGNDDDAGQAVLTQLENGEYRIRIYLYSMEASYLLTHRPTKQRWIPEDFLAMTLPDLDGKSADALTWLDEEIPRFQSLARE